MVVTLQSTCSQKIKNKFYYVGQLHFDTTTCLVFDKNSGRIRLEDLSKNGAFFMMPASLLEFTKKEMNDEIKRLMNMGTFTKTVKE